MESVHGIMERAEAAGTDPEQELQQAVRRAVLEGVVTGFQMSSEDDTGERNRPPSSDDATVSKRSRTEEN
jgi:hypothetical protein